MVLALSLLALASCATVEKRAPAQTPKTAVVEAEAGQPAPAPSSAPVEAAPPAAPESPVAAEPAEPPAAPELPVAAEPSTPPPAAAQPARAAPEPVAPAAVAGGGTATPAPLRPSAPGAAKLPPPTLDLASLEKRLRDTKAIGFFTKISLKNQVDDLLEKFRAYYQGRSKTGPVELRQPYDLLLLKVLSLLQDTDPALARDIVASREAIWSILSDRQKFTESNLMAGET